MTIILSLILSLGLTTSYAAVDGQSIEQVDRVAESAAKNFARSRGGLVHISRSFSRSGATARYSAETGNGCEFTVEVGTFMRTSISPGPGC